jgi:hypothetical protein
MKKIAGLAALLILAAVPAFAQESQSAPAPKTATQSNAETPKPHEPRYLPKYEISGAGSYYSFYAPTQTTLGMLGWNATFQYNFRKWVGLEAEGFGEYYNQGTNGKTSIYSGLGGGQFYPFGRRKVTVYVHGLVGYGRYRITFPAFGGFGFSAVNKSTEVYELGGGFDYNLRKHWTVRMIQADFDKADYYSGNLTRSSYRLSIGAVYRFGQR